MDAANWPYPRQDISPQVVQYIIGDTSNNAQLRWNVASAYFFLMPTSQCLRVAPVIDHSRVAQMTNISDSFTI